MIEDSRIPPDRKVIQRAHQDLNLSTEKFQNALDIYNTTANADEKVRLKGIMDQQLALIKAAVGELKRGGVYKQEEKVEKDYQAYISTGSEESFAALSHDLVTLKDYNRL